MKNPPPWKEIRASFDLDPNYLHFGCFWLSSYPRQVRDAIDRHRAGLDANPVFYVMDNELRLDAVVREALARFAGADADRVILTTSTTEGLMLGVGMLNLSANDEIVVTRHEHYSAYHATQELARRSRARLRTISLYEDGESVSPDLILDRVQKAISKRTRCLMVTWVHSCTGVKLPLTKIGALVRAVNASRPARERILLCVDGTHGFGALETNIKSFGCDIFVSSCHKWLNGPHGTGFVAYSPRALARSRPLLPSFAPGPLGRFTRRLSKGEKPWERLTPGGFHAFENRWAVSDAVAFMTEVGIARAQQHIASLSSQLKQGLQACAKARLVTPLGSEASAGIVCFEIEGLSPEEVVSRLRAHNVVASVSPYKIRYARLTPGVYNCHEEVEEVLRRLAFAVKT